MSSLESLPAQARVRLDDVEVSRSRDGWCTVEVRLFFPDGTRQVGESGTHDTKPGLIRAGAEATLDALSKGLKGQATPELRGAKGVRAFDAQLVIVSVRVRTDAGRTDLLGAVESPPRDLARGGALAALDALNRVLAKDLPADRDAPRE